MNGLLPQESFAMRNVVELVYIRYEEPESILNVVDDKERTIRKGLGIYFRNSKQALEDVEASHKRYTTISPVTRLTWALKGHDKVNGLESKLSAFATQLDSSVNGLCLLGVAKLYQDQRKTHKGIGRIEVALENIKGNDEAAVQTVMQAMDQVKLSPESTER